MLRLLCGIIFTALLLSVLGCGGGKPAGGDKVPGINKTGDEPPKTGQTTPPPEPPKKEPSPEEKWLADTCGRCHPPETQKDLLAKIMAMTSEELDAALRNKCLASLKDKPGVTFTEEEIAKAIELHKAAKAKEAEKSSAPPTN